MQYTTRDVARLLGLSEAQVRSYVRAGLVEVERGPRNAYRFTFQDLVLLRTARGLVAARLPAARIVRALRRLREQLPDDRSLTALRISVDGEHVVVSDGGASWNPESGQLHLEFAVSDLAAEVAPLHAQPAAAAHEPDADEWFARGLELELVAAGEARAAYEQALELEPGHADAHVNLGRLLHEAGRLAEAEIHYRAALAAGPHATAAYNLGIVLEDRKKPAAAADAYRLALIADARFADAHYNLGCLCEQLGDQQGALRHLNSYRKLTQGSGRA